jgi:hypothetical protein
MVEPPGEVLARVWKRIETLDEAASDEFFQEK